MVVSLHDEGEVLDADDEQQGPEGQREDAEEVGEGCFVTADSDETLAECVEGAGGDIAEDDTKSGEG